MALLDIKNLKVNYDRIEAIKGIDLSVKADDRCIALVGSNGAGKSTLVNAITGLVDYQGDIFSSDITTFSIKTKVGRVDKSGGIYDTRKEIPEKIGSIDTRGNITDERFFGSEDLSH